MYGDWEELKSLFLSDNLPLERTKFPLRQTAKSGSLRAAFGLVKENLYTEGISLSCERFCLAERVYLRGLWMNSKETLLYSFSLCRWFGITSNAPHAVLEHHPPRHEPHSANAAAATHLLVPWCSPYPLLLPTLSSDGVHGEPQPWSSENDPEQWTVCRLVSSVVRELG